MTKRDHTCPYCEGRNGFGPYAIDFLEENDRDPTQEEEYEEACEKGIQEIIKKGGPEAQV